MIKKENTQSQKLRTYVGIAVFSALAYVVVLIAPIKVSFLTLDFKTAVITLAGLIYGPMATFAASLVSCLLEAVTISDTQFWGFLMNFLASFVFSATVTVLYRYQHNKLGAVLSLFAGVAALTVVMVPANLFITPIYMKVTREAVVSLLLPLLIPFNVAKGLLNAAAVALLYKPIITAMRKIGWRESSGESQIHKKDTVIWAIAAAFAIAVAVGLLILLNRS